MRVWIEIPHRYQHIEDHCFTLLILPLNLALFHPLMRVWIEISSNLGAGKMHLLVSPSYEGVD